VAWAAEKYKIPLRGVEVRVSQSRGPAGHLFRVALDLQGDLDESQRAQLERAAGHCPVSRTLQHPITIDARVTVRSS
ncbi:MAG TPA: OsmC family protein, partial [Polyangia bacterium]